MAMPPLLNMYIWEINIGIHLKINPRIAEEEAYTYIIWVQPRKVCNEAIRNDDYRVIRYSHNMIKAKMIILTGELNKWGNWQNACAKVKEILWLCKERYLPRHILWYSCSIIV